MIESTLGIVLSDTKDAEEWLMNLKSVDYNCILTTIFDKKMCMRLKEDKDAICTDMNKWIEKIRIIEESRERKDWYDEIEETKEFCKQFDGEELVVSQSEPEIPKPENIIAPLLGYIDRLRDVEEIRKIQNGKELYEDIKEWTKQISEKQKEVSPKKKEIKKLKETEKLEKKSGGK
jgi:hypothetical protein